MNKLTRQYRLFLVSIILLGLVACQAGGLRNAPPEEQRRGIQSMRQDVLTKLYASKPDTRAQIGSASGYAVFSNANINLVFASFGGGRGVIHDNSSGTDTYMRMGEVGVGLGAGVKDFRAIFVFHDHDALERFLDVGLSIGGQADVAVKAGDLGAAAGGEALIDNVSVYQLTESGIALQATIKGTRYWQDAELNQQTAI
jgi:lipid-binding SYLF domain-containing protein